VDLDRQEVPRRASGRPEPPQRVPETSPPLLGDWFIYLSVVVLFCGVIAISALNLGAELSSGVVRFPALVGVGLLIVISADAAVRVCRSAWAWMPVDLGHALFRFVWTAVLGAVFVAGIGAVFFLVSI
jgi:hypothetical protein